MTRFLVFFLSFVLVSCQEIEIDLSQYTFQDPSLELKVVASEPDIVAPVAIDFDKAGRLWVAEMPDYMPDINGEKESIPQGRILILEDTNGDGHMDKVKVFKDKIHHLRSIRLFKDGILFADNPNLYYAKIKDDQPYDIEIIDSTYAQGGNIEHKPNGLLKNIDNCFYNAKSHYRYCYSENGWTKEAVYFRGQWGITSDQNGRIYSNDNSNFLYGDALLPAMLTHNKYIPKLKEINQDLVGDRTVFPIQATAINRGYNDGVLDQDGKLVATSSACGPYIHQSLALGESYISNAFVCVPEANLIKQLKVNTNDLIPEAEYVYENSEFLVSHDESFRPVNMAVGPDGEIYIVDFHRGIIQHKIYMSNYLREQIIKRDLEKVVNYGRILRVQKKEKDYQTIRYEFNNQDSLLHYLSSSNEWVRRMAHEELAYLSSDNLDEKLYSNLNKGSKSEKLHSLWILDARKTIDLEKINKITFTDPWLIANLFKLLSQEKYQWEGNLLNAVFEKYRSNLNPIIQNHIIAASHIIYKTSPILHKNLKENNPNTLIASQLSSYPNGVLAEEEGTSFEDYNSNVSNNKKYYIHDKRSAKVNEKNGYTLYNDYCSSCHGFGGHGSKGQAPALIGAKLINSSKTVLPLIMIHGLKGGVSIDGQVEEYPSVMPSFVESANLSSSDITEISNYIFNAFRDERISIDQQLVEDLLKKHKERELMWTEEELLRTE